MTTWTADRTEILIQLRKLHQPVSIMAERLGITRNAIIGKLHRLGLSVARIRRSVPTLIAPEKASRIGITLMQLTSKTCHWPLGDPQQPDFGFCGNLILEGCPYCAEHAKLAYNRGGSIKVTMKASAYWRKRY
jgi:GcrA cell cycle regulator